MNRKKTIKLTVACGAVALICAAVIQTMKIIHIKKTELSCPENSRLSIAAEEVPAAAGEILVYSDGKSSLYLDCATLRFRVEDMIHGTEWKSYIEGTSSGSEQALLTVSYLGKDNNLQEWNSYDNCVKFGSYRLNRLADGIRITMNLNQGESENFYEYLPKKMSIERYDTVFVQGLEKAARDGKIDKAALQKYKLTLSLVYKKSIMENCYAVTYAGTPPASAVTQMIRIAKAVGYTNEMLKQDAADFDFAVVTAEAADFDIAMDLRIEAGDLVVSIPSELMISNNPYFEIQNVKVLCNFGAVTQEQCPSGYLFVPDGCGALMAMNSYISGVPDYVRPVYDNEYYKDYYFMSDYSEKLYMPVFGLTYGQGSQALQGFAAVIEDGASTSFINTKLASSNSGEGIQYNKVFASFDIEQFADTKVYGPYSDKSTAYQVRTGRLRTDCTVRYCLLGKGASYFTMAQAYRRYLETKCGYRLSARVESTKLYLEVPAALALTKRILGIPYKYIKSMTGYSQLQEILQDLEGIPAVVSYNGMFNGGLNSRLAVKAQAVKQCGTMEELGSLQHYAFQHGDELYYGVSFSRIYTGGNGYIPRLHAARDFSNAPLSVYRYNPANGLLCGYFSSDAQYYTVLAPQYLENTVQQFLQTAGNYTSLYLPDLGGMCYADYALTGMTDIYASGAAVQQVLGDITAEKKTVIDNPFMDSVKYASVVSSVARSSSDYATFLCTVPFRQLVLNGYVPYTTENINMSAHSADYYVLQNAELASWPKFTVTAESTDVLADSSYSWLYSAQYKALKETVKDVYGRCCSIRNQIGSGRITDHELLSSGVFRTTYDNGTKVTVNYNLYPVILASGRQLESLAYSIEDQGSGGQQ